MSVRAPHAAPWQRLTLLQRVLFISGLALAVAGALLLFVSTARDAEHLRDQMAENLTLEMESLLLALADDVVTGDFASIEQELRERVKRRDIARMAFLPARGGAVEATDKVEPPRAPTWFAALARLPAPEMRRPLVVGGRNYGEVVIRMTTTPALDRLWQNFVSHLSILLLAVAIDFTGIFLVLKSATRPLAALGEGARALERGDLSHRIPRQGSPELLEVIDAFNRMAAALSAAREALHDESERLRVTLESIGDGVIATDTEGRVEFMNRVAEALTGWTAGEARGRSILEVFVIVNETTRAEVECPVGRCLREGVIVDLANHTLLIARDGRERPIADSAAPIRGADGRTHGAVLVFRDQSEERALIERLRLTASVFEHSLNGVMIADAQKHLVEVNPAYTRITGFTREEAIGAPPKCFVSGINDARLMQTVFAELETRGHWHGEMNNQRKDGTLFPMELAVVAVRDEEGRPTHYIGIFRDLTQIKAQEAQLRHLAYHDALTGLPNRALLADRMRIALAHAQRSGERLAVCYLDLDGFKPINDRLGHAVGDRLLQEIARRLEQAVRGGDTVARLGGDEFVLLLNHLTGLEQCKNILDRLLQSVTQPLLIDGESLTIHASIGVTLYPDDAADADTLLRHADQALYAAKETGRNRYQFFDVRNAFVSREHRSVLARLEEALEKGEFRLYYQPKVDVREGKVVAVEALIRWQHPERGLVLPGEFLPRLAGSELEQRVGEWVISTALGQMATWRAAGLDFLVCVNISPHHLAQPDFPVRLGELLRRHAEVPPERLELEVLESAALDDMDSVLPLMEACRSLGVQFALDDFGTGYSSLTYLKRLPVSVLKIDQSFVRDMLDNPEDQAIVAGIIGLSEAFHIAVVAEGVETSAHVCALLRMGCGLLQGYGIARPMPAEAIPSWVANWRPDAAWVNCP